MKVRATSRMPRPIYLLYKESKCRECTVVVTKMDFAKILGKFTKVKIQYESTSPKGKPNTKSQSPVRNTNSRLKNIENSMVLIHRNAFKKNSIKELNSPKKPQFGKSNVLKENNTIKKSPIPKRKHTKKQKLLRYGLVFTDPKARTYEERNNISLQQLLVSIDNSLLPLDWCLEYFPKIDEPKEDAVYDKIAAELEDMYSEPKKIENAIKADKDEFPSILDILNENVTDSKSGESDKNVSNDVEAMITEATRKKDISTLMEVDSAEVSTKSNLENNIDTTVKTNTSNNSLQEPLSPSLLEEADQLIKEPKPAPKPSDKTSTESKSGVTKDIKKKDRNVTHIVFKLMKDGNCRKSVTCPKNLKYTIELGGKHVELLGAPKFVSSIEDLKVLLQIVNESELESFYVYH